MFFLQDNPVEVVKALEKEGVEAYKGATQLSTVFRTKQSEEKDEAEKNQGRCARPEPVYSSLLPQTEVAAAVGMASSTGDSSKAIGAAKTSNLTSAEFVCSAPSAGVTGPSHSFSKEKNDVLFPHNAKYLIDHVLYLPVHKRVSFWYLEHICSAVENVMRNRIGVKIEDTRNVLFKSKI